MFAVVPLGVEGGEVRFPIVGLGILVACVGLFALTWLAEPSPMGTDEVKTRAAVEYWVEHPYLELGEDFAHALLSDAVRAPMDTLRAQWRANNTSLLPSVISFEQERLDELCAAALAAVHPTLFRTLALERARGWLQPGWVTYMFLHAGWLHLLGNLLFLYAVALLLEDAWGRGLFLGFYLLGGVVSGAAEYFLSGNSALVLVGASGAVSACIGAAMVRFATRKMRMGYLLLFRVGTFTVPMWLWGLFRAGSEVYDLASGQTGGVAVLAHVVGLGFGAAVALGMKAAGLDRTLVATDEVRHAPAAPTRSYARDVEAGHAALAQGDREGARAFFDQARQADPNDTDALRALLALDLEQGRRTQALPMLERVVQALLRSRQVDEAAQVVRASLPPLRPQELRAGFALLVVKSLGNSLPRDLVRSLWLRAAEEPGPQAPMAWLTAAELALEVRDVEGAHDALAKVDPTGQAPAFVQRIERAHAKLEGLGARLAAPEADVAAAPAPMLARKRQTIAVSLLTARTEGLSLQPQAGPARLVQLHELKAVAAGYVTTRDLRRVLVVFLVLDWGNAQKPAVMLRLDSDTGGVEKLRPGVDPKQAYLQFLGWLAQKSGAVALPDAARLASGELPFCADAGALEQALFAPLER